MPPKQLAPVRTPIDPNELALALCRAYHAVLGTWPSRGSVLTLLAQSSLETGHWAACVCFNLGNVKSREGDGRSWTYFRCSEVELRDGRRVEVFYDPPSPTCRFRAFGTLDEGAADHLGFLARSSRYRKAWEAVLVGNPRGFVRELSRAGYFTASEQPYEDTVARLFDHYGALPFEVPSEDPVDDQTRQAVLALVSRTALGSVEEFTNPPIVEPEPAPDTQPSPEAPAEPPTAPDRASMRGKRQKSQGRLLSPEEAADVRRKIFGKG